MALIRQLSLLCLGMFLAAVAACTSPGATQCEATGVLCPIGSHCAAAEPVCITDTQTCGDAHMDKDEECDDGNTKDGDGCSHECKIEKCGNGRTDFGEVCDKGANNGKCMGCAADCKSFEACGDGVLDGECGEVCDDHNTKDGDGCSRDCKSTESCGNGITDTSVGEVCDPPHAGTCSPDCRSLLTCGNGKIDPGEECDDGQASNGDDKDCRSDCVINRCGDGRPNTHGTHHEDCDRGPLTADHLRTAVPTEAADCNIDCTTPRCGDGKVNHSFTPPGASGTEQCDNGGANADNADCTAHCQLSVCGDSLLNTAGPARREGCDDGNRVDTDSCTNACIAKSCGDGIVGPGEQCDLGPNNSDTGACLTNCLIATCGDGKTYAGVEECDGGPGCSAACKLQRCGNGIIDPGEECDDAAGNGDDKDCRSDCIVNRCGDGHVNAHGTHHEICDDAPAAPAHSTAVTPTETAGCNIDCTTPMCGDGKVNHSFTPPGAAGPEQCDNGGANADNADCTAHCQVSVCGDNLHNTVGPLLKEGCDDGNRIDTDACTNACVAKD
ncbi:MAG: DUF4215 domain-containing protein [Deltaproteobacteria bacterium]|nr:MAG: DUF4215 domain-containing protein [Deltaproteobacteria bacterium]